MVRLRILFHQNTIDHNYCKIYEDVKEIVCAPDNDKIYIYNVKKRHIDIFLMREIKRLIYESVEDKKEKL